jgi:hypothetical protein
MSGLLRLLRFLRKFGRSVRLAFIRLAPSSCDAASPRQMASDFGVRRKCAIYSKRLDRLEADGRLHTKQGG